MRSGLDRPVLFSMENPLNDKATELASEIEGRAAEIVPALFAESRTGEAKDVVLYAHFLVVALRTISADPQPL